MSKLKYYCEWAWDTCFGLIHNSGKYSKEWDEKLNQILDTGDFKFDKHVMYYKDYVVWTGSRFFTFGCLFLKDNRQMGERYRPKVSTMVRLAMLQDEWVKENVKTKKQTTLDIIRSIEIEESK